MGESEHTLKYRKDDTTHSIKLYDSIDDVGDDRLAVRVGGQTLYAKLGGVGDPNASDMRVRKNNTTYAILTQVGLNTMIADADLTIDSLNIYVFWGVHHEHDDVSAYVMRYTGESARTAYALFNFPYSGVPTNFVFYVVGVGSAGNHVIEQVDAEWNDNNEIPWASQPSVIGGVLDTIYLSSTGWYTADVSGAQEPTGDHIAFRIRRTTSATKGLAIATREHPSDVKPYIEY